MAARSLSKREIYAIAQAWTARNTQEFLATPVAGQMIEFFQADPMFSSLWDHMQAGLTLGLAKELASQEPVTFTQSMDGLLGFIEEEEGFQEFIREGEEEGEALLEEMRSIPRLMEQIFEGQLKSPQENFDSLQARLEGLLQYAEAHHLPPHEVIADDDHYLDFQRSYLDLDSVVTAKAAMIETFTVEKAKADRAKMIETVPVLGFLLGGQDDDPLYEIELAEEIAWVRSEIAKKAIEDVQRLWPDVSPDTLAVFQQYIRI